MAGKIPYLDRKGAIIAVLSQCARQGRTIFYGELGPQVEVPARGPWKSVLDEIAREETAKGRPLQTVGASPRLIHMAKSARKTPSTIVNRTVPRRRNSIPRSC